MSKKRISHSAFIFISTQVQLSLFDNESRVPAPGFKFLNLILHSHDLNMHVEGLLPADLSSYFIKIGIRFAI